MKEAFILGYVLLFSLCFFVGTEKAKDKRGMYLNRPASSSIPVFVWNLGVSIVGIILFSYLIYLYKNTMDIFLIKLLFSFLIFLVFVEIYLSTNKKLKKFIKILKIKKYQNNDSDSSDDTDYNDSIGIMDTAVCKGMKPLLFISSIIFLVFYGLDYFDVTDVFYNLLIDFGLANCFALMLFNSIILFIFTLFQFNRFLSNNTSNNNLNTYDSVADILNGEVKN
ncbi:hypothetical protein IMSAGC017_01318 [Thomasclavelia cocleata]|uniref:Uncharacterized protein n=1 Tax=Thomasclavelia cocleata TaxID=69824 RepID=A0A829ZBF4_9FIRM|nr:hypothetical protein [Thomasclavelia cocleata]GFI41275.1 hypothetical protein IMSAGC017_01318 [Thomasclavelia cocleata]